MPGIKQPDAHFQGHRGELRHRCRHCEEVKDKLLRCAGCNSVRYCSKEHQVANWSKHKSECSAIERFRTDLAKEEERSLQKSPTSISTPANVFETQAGRFSGIHPSQGYMRACSVLAQTLSVTGTLDSISEALSHLTNLVRLDRSDDLNLRYRIPALMLQLDKDQECYDFIKWYQTNGQSNTFGWISTTVPFLDIRDVVVLEKVDFMEPPHGSGDLNFMGVREGNSNLDFLAAIMLLKMKLVIDCANIRVMRKALAGKLPLDIWHTVGTHVVRSPISVSLCRKSNKELETVENTLKDQILRLGNIIQDVNEYFFGGLLEPDHYFQTRPGKHSSDLEPVPLEEMRIALQNGFSAWWQHEGVLELLHSAKILAKKDADYEMDSFVAEINSRGNSHLTREGLLEDMGRTRLWAYIDWAVEDSRSFCDERPSDKHLRERRSSQHKTGEEDLTMKD